MSTPMLVTNHTVASESERARDQCQSEAVTTTRAGTNTPSDEYDTYRDTGWRIRYVSRIHFFSEAKLGNG